MTIRRDGDQNMKTETVIRELGLKEIVGGAPEDYEGVYAGDLLSRAMSRIGAGELWITIMSNINVVAVANLTEAAAVILAEGVEMTDDVISAARDKNVAVYSSGMTVYEICSAICSLKDQ